MYPVKLLSLEKVWKRSGGVSGTLMTVQFASVLREESGNHHGWEKSNTKYDMHCLSYFHLLKH